MPPHPHSPNPAFCLQMEGARKRACPPPLPSRFPRGTLSWGDIWDRRVGLVFLPANLLFRFKGNLSTFSYCMEEKHLRYMVLYSVTPSTESFLAEACGERLQPGPCLWSEPSLGSALFPSILVTTVLVVSSPVSVRAEHPQYPDLVRHTNTC